MKFIVCENYDDMSVAAAKIVKEVMVAKPDCILGLATGSTPIGLYKNLIHMYKTGEIDFSQVKSFNLDEYYPIMRENPQSYYYFMHENLFDHVNIKEENTHVPNGEVTDPETECEEYDAALAAAGGVDIQVLGIGRNGHIGFNEPDSYLYANTHVTPLTEDTLDANSRFFGNDRPIDHAITMGMSTILSAKKIIILANGESKHNAVAELLSDKISTACPATLLKLHPDVTVICDKKAYSDRRIGVDIGGSSIKIGVVDNNEIVDSKVIDMLDADTPEKFLDAIVKECKSYGKEYKIGRVGVGTPGYVVDGKVMAANLPFKNYPVAEYLSNQLGIPVKVQNDANCAALGESKAGAAKSYNNSILLTLGTGIGSGVIINNKIYAGKGSAGEVGHMCIEVNGRPCPCGQKGCWEQYASARALINSANEAADANPDSYLGKLKASGAKITGTTFFAAIGEKCPVAEAVLDEFTSYLAAGIISLVNIFDPEIVIIAGGISNAGDLLLNPLKAKLNANINVDISVLKNDAGMIGAANL